MGDDKRNILIGDGRVTVEIDLGSVWVSDGEATLSDVILNKAARQLLDGLGREERDYFRRRAASIMDAEILEAIRPALAEALEKAIQRTNGFGEPVGEPTTLSSLISARASEQLKQRADGRGYDSVRATVLERIVHDAVDSALQKELREAIDAAKVEVIATVRAKGAEVIAETMRRAIS